MQEVKLNFKKGQIKVFNSLLKYEYENKKTLEEFILDLVELGLDTMLENLTEDKAIEVIKDVADQD